MSGAFTAAAARPVGSRRRRLAGAALAGYLLGTVPSADLAARLAKGHVDIRAEGSGNPGAMNTARVLGRGWGAAVLGVDLGKGIAAAVTGRALAGDDGAYLAATASIAGHVAPVWTGFRGGKGVATSAGVSLAVFPMFFPVNLAVTLYGALRDRQAERATQVACAMWVASSVVAWRAHLNAGWGPEPGPGLVLSSVAGSAMVLGRFAQARRAGGTRPEHPQT